MMQKVRKMILDYYFHAAIKILHLDLALYTLLFLFPLPLKGYRCIVVYNLVCVLIVMVINSKNKTRQEVKLEFSYIT